MAFATVALAELVLVFSCRSPREAAWRVPRNVYLLASVAASVALVALAVYLPALQEPLGTSPLGLGEAALVLALALVPAALAEAGKAVLRRISEKPNEGAGLPGWPASPLGEGGLMNQNRAIVEARTASKTYDTGKVQVNALREVDLVVERGEMVGDDGPERLAARRTLLNCLSGLDAIDSGDVLIEGVSLTSMSDRERTDYRARRMGFVFQFYNLMPVLTAVENVELPLLVARVAAEGGAPARAGRARARRPRPARRAPPRGALGRRAPARHDRPLARQRPGDRLGRRADRRPRQRERRARSSS